MGIRDERLDIDFDDDGWPDIYIACKRPSILITQQS